MIQPNELRIGNYVEYKGQIFPVLNVDALNEYKETGDKGTVTLPVYLPDGTVIDTVGKWLSKINPIPITPEILERLGFVKCESDDIDKRTIYSIQVDNNHSLYFDPTEDPQWYISHQWNNNHFKNSFWFQPEFLHGVQNLYYSLTGIELTFKTN
jgi:hypothetical protein